MVKAAALLTIAASSMPAAAMPAPYPSWAAAWQIGPIIGGKNYSAGMPLHPSMGRRGWFIDFPYPTVEAGHVHYITLNHGPLTGKNEIVMRYRIEANPGVRFVPRETPGVPATLSLFFQRRGDTWTARGRYATYRWYAPSQTVMPITPGEHSVTVSLNDNWTSVNGRAAAADPMGFREAVDDAEKVGIVLGSAGARGHGVYATGPARLTVTSFQVR
jgi:hypothetical protein